MLEKIAKLKKLASRTVDVELKAELIAEIEALEKMELISKPKDLAEFLNSNEQAKNEQASNLSVFRKKWEKEAEEKLKKDKQKPAGEQTFEEKMLEQMGSLTENFTSLSEKVTGLESGNKIATLSDYAQEKGKDLPKELSALIAIKDDTTEADIDQQVILLTTAHGDVIKSIDTTPGAAKQIPAGGNAAEWKEALPIKEKAND